VPLARGFRYLAAILDWFSRYVIAWRLSNTLDGSFCLEVLEEALSRGRPEVFNTDQGVQFTAQAWTGRLEAAGVAVSMDGKGRCLDNVFVERLVADGQVRGHLSVAVRRGAATATGARALLPVLQRRAAASGAGLPDTCGGLQAGASRREVGRVKGRHSFFPPHSLSPGEGRAAGKRMPRSRAAGQRCGRAEFSRTVA
jgi:transposase InsO family protein